MGFEINEKSSFCLPFTLTDKDGEPLSPVTSVSWWIGIPGTPTILVPKQEVDSPTYQVEIVVPAEANICSGDKKEKRFVAVRVQSGDEHVKHAAFTYSVKALDAVPYPGEESQEGGT